MIADKIIIEAIDYKNGEIDAQDLADALRDFASDLDAMIEARLDNTASDQEVMRSQHSLSSTQLGIKL